MGASKAAPAPRRPRSGAAPPRVWTSLPCGVGPHSGRRAVSLLFLVAPDGGAVHPGGAIRHLAVHRPGPDPAVEPAVTREVLGVEAGADVVRQSGRPSPRRSLGHEGKGAPEEVV